MLFKKKTPPPERRARLPQSAGRPNAVFSYHANRSVREGGEQFRDAATFQRQQSVDENGKTSRIRRFRKRAPAYIALGGVLIIGFLSLQLSSKAKVVPVDDSEGQVFLRDVSVYADAANKEFSSFLNGNKLTVDAGRITADMQKQFPELRVVSVSLPIIGSQPVVYIQPAAPKLILTSRAGMYVLDGNGRALITGNQVLKLQQLDVPVVTDESGLQIEVGKAALPGATVSFVSEVVGQLKQKGLGVSSMTLPSGTNELYIKPDGVGYQVKFNLHGDPREEVGTFLATKQYLDGKHSTPREYIDVRVENKAYYR